MQGDHANATQAWQVLGKPSAIVLRTTRAAMAPGRKKKTTKAKAATRRKPVKSAARSAKTKLISSKLISSKLTKSKSSGSLARKAKPDPLDDLIVASAKALALTIEPAWTSAVRANLHVIFAQAALVTAFELPDDAEPAPIFKA
jgi:Protein of unknown function (DUF4089)